MIHICLFYICNIKINEMILDIIQKTKSSNMVGCETTATHLQS